MQVKNKNIDKKFYRAKICCTKGSDYMGFRKQGQFTYSFECMVKGKRFYKTYKTYDKSKSEVQKNFLLWKIDCEKNMFVNCDLTFAEYAEIWLNNYCSEYSPLVKKSYRCNLKNRILPQLGSYKLNEITPVILDKFISYLKSDTTQYKYRISKELSNETIRKNYAIARSIIKTAYKKGLITTDPTTRVALEFKRAIGPKEKHYYDIKTCRKVLSLLQKENTDNAKVIEFAMKTGLRRSEIWGLSWDDVNFRRKTISINKTLQKVNKAYQVLPCKSKTSFREISVPDTVIDLIKDYRCRHPENFYIFSNLDYDSLTAWFRKWQVQHGIDKIRFHDLRHTHATLLLYKGIDIKTISERLGHSNIGITMNVYTHVMKELDTAAAKAINTI